MKEKHLRILMTAVGIAMCGVSIGVMQHARFGTDPFTVLITGLGNLVHAGYGVVFTVFASILLIVVFLLKRRLIGLSTIFTLVGIGAVVEFASRMVERLLPNPNLPVRVLELAIGLLLVCIGASLYYTADLGVSPYDAMALILAERSGIPFRFCRIGTDAVCVAVGFITGAIIGIGTIVTALCMGPLIDLFNRRLAQPLLRLGVPASASTDVANAA